MPIFFFVGGYLAINIEKIKYSRLMITKAKRLLVPFCSWTLVAVGARSILSARTLTVKKLIGDYINNLLFAQSMWFFLAMFEVFMIAKVILALWRKNKIISILIYFLLIFLPLHETFLALNQARQLLCFFIFGYVLTRKKVEIINFYYNIPCRNQGKAAVLLFCAVITFVFIPLYAASHVVVKIFYETAALMLSLSVVCPKLYQIKGVGQCGIKLGVYSMECYCLHMMFVKYLPLQRLTPVMVQNIFCLNLLWNIGLTALTAMICVLFSEKVLNKFKYYRYFMLGNWDKQEGERPYENSNFGRRPAK